MPTYRSITISLISQFDILTIPEFAPPTTPADPFSNAPTLVNPAHSLVSVYIPTYPSSQFWLSYSISPPHPPKLLYYFKLYLNGGSIVSWGCGEDNDYRGKTMFGLFKPSRTSNLAKEATSQRRVLCFGPDIGGLDNRALDNLSDVMEIKVFRSKGRKRIKPDVQKLQSFGNSLSIGRKGSQQQVAGGINLVNAGALLDKHPQRYYKYALLDPLDTPFATFRYYYRSWDQLESLGVISPYASESSSITSIESSPSRSLQNLAPPAERPLSPRDSSNTLESNVSVSASSESIATNGASDMAEAPKDSSSDEAATATKANKSTIEDSQHSDNTGKTTAAKATDEDTESQSTTNSPEESPLKIPFFLPHPPTPPPSSTPSKLAQLPNIIPPTIKDLNALASKESFASLIRKRLPDPDPSAFQLTDPNPPIEPASPTTPIRDRADSLGKRSGTVSMGVLMSVVNSAKTRRRREAAGAGSSVVSSSEEEAPSEGERTDGETGESVSIGSGSDGGSGKARDQSCGAKKKKEKKKGAEEKGRRRERRRNLWEEL